MFLAFGVAKGAREVDGCVSLGPRRALLFIVRVCLASLPVVRRRPLVVLPPTLV